jgi:hypothetical protein
MRCQERSQDRLDILDHIGGASGPLLVEGSAPSFALSMTFPCPIAWDEDEEEEDDDDFLDDDDEDLDLGDDEDEDFFDDDEDEDVDDEEVEDDE